MPARRAPFILALGLLAASLAAAPDSSVASKPVAWPEAGLRFEVPDNWEQTAASSELLSFHLPANSDAANLTVTVSPLGDDSPVAASLRADREAARREQEAGRLASFDDHPIGQAKGLVQFEAASTNSDDIRRFIWVGYQKRQGWNQITIIFSARSAALARYESTFRRILSSFHLDSD